MGAISGADGGDGTVTVTEVSSVLNYNKKEIILNVNDTYNIDKDEISYTKLNEKQTEDIEVGNIIYEIEGQDNNIISVDNTGEIIAKTVGTARVKITDTDNEKLTYIVIKVIDQIAETDIKNGSEFTVALKSNGTVWRYGKMLQEVSNEPIEVVKENDEPLENIVKIGAGEKAAIALGKDGKVYTWGLCYEGTKQLEENGKEEIIVEEVKEKQKATLIEGLENIVEVSAKRNNFYAVDKDRKCIYMGTRI